MIARLASFLAVLLGATVVGAPEATPQSVGRTVLIEIATSEGEITAEIYIERAPVTAGNFLAYVDDLLFDRGSFFRSVRMDNQPDDSIRIEVIQGGPDGRAVRARLRPPIPLERTNATGPPHPDGAPPMPRGGPAPRTPRPLSSAAAAWMVRGLTSRTPLAGPAAVCGWI